MTRRSDLSLWPKYLLWLCRTPAQNQGMTLIEVLVAILIIAVVTSVIAAPIVLTVGTRVQNRKTEEGIQLAQRYIEDIRVELARGDDTTNFDTLLADAGDSPTMADDGTIQGVPAPTTLCSTDPCAVNSLEPVDYDGDGDTDFYVQAFRANDKSTTGFEMAVRVYPLGVVNGSTVRSGLSTDASAVGFRASGDSQSDPLATFYTGLYRGSNGTSLSALGGTTSSSTTTTSTTGTSTTGTSTSTTGTPTPATIPIPTTDPKIFSNTTTGSSSSTTDGTTTTDTSTTGTTDTTGSSTTGTTDTTTTGSTNQAPIAGDTDICIKQNQNNVTFNVVSGVLASGTYHLADITASSDPNGNSLTITSVSSVTTISSDNPIGSPTFSGTTITFSSVSNNGRSGSFTFTISDGSLTDTGTIRVEISNNESNCDQFAPY